MTDLPEDPSIELARRERLKRLTDRQDLMDVVCAHVASGGTLISLANIYDVNYGELSNHVTKDIERNRRYRAALNDRGEWAIERVLQELRRVAFSDVRSIFALDGAIKHPSEWPEDIARAIASIEVFEEFEGKGNERELIGHTKRVKFWDKGRALELLGKNLKLFIDRMEIGGSVRLEDLILKSGAKEGDPIQEAAKKLEDKRDEIH